MTIGNTPLRPRSANSTSHPPNRLQSTTFAEHWNSRRRRTHSGRARVIWQESCFDALAVSPKGAAGIAQFMPATASWHGLANPFDPIEALRHSAAYLRELLSQFGNLGLAAAAYNAGPARVSAWLANHRAQQLLALSPVDGR